MLTDGEINPWKAVASLPPLLYGVLLGMKLPNAAFVLTTLVVVLLAALWLISYQDYS